MKQPLKGWRKILATIAGTTVAVLFPAAAPLVAKLIGLYVGVQGVVDAAEAVRDGMKGKGTE